MQKLISLLQETVQEWNDDKAPRLAAALAYYTIFSIAPFLIVVIAIAGLVFEQDDVRGRVLAQVTNLVGSEGAGIIRELLQSTYNREAGIVAAVLGLATLLLGAAGLFGQLKDALNTVWDAEPQKGNGIIMFFRERLLSFTMLLGVGFLLMVSLVLSVMVAALDEFMVGLLPGWQTVLQLVNIVVSIGVISILFALLFKFLPDVRLEWRDVIVGAVVTAVLFTIGKTALGLYLGNSGVASAYGAAGSLIVLLLWIYYSSQILLLGAEFTQVYARRYGSLAEKPAPAQPVVSAPAHPVAVPPVDESLAAATVTDTETTEKPATLKDRMFGVLAIAVMLVVGWISGTRKGGKQTYS